jgi:hypothetical protein
VELGVHLPLIDFGDGAPSLARLTRVPDAARECGFAAVAANDHLLFVAPWLDGPTALAAVLEHTGAVELATTVALVSVRGALATMWTRITDDAREADRVLHDVLGPLLRRDPEGPPQPALRRAARALRRAARPVRARGMRARPPVAGRRRGAPDRARRGAGGQS